MKYKDYYKIMEVSSNASIDEIKQAYHRLARKYHPDISKEPNAEARFKEINEAYEVLKEPQKRAVYNASFKVILPYSYAWFVAKKKAFSRTTAQRYAKKKARQRANFLGRKAKVPTHARAHTLEESNMKPTKKFPLILMGVFVLVLVAIIIGVFFAMEQYDKWQDHQQIMADIRQGDETAIETFERQGVEIQKQILEGEHVKKALVDYYLQHADRPILAQLETYDETIESDILTDDEVYRALKAHYYQQIEAEIQADNFDLAHSKLKTLKNKYPHSRELSEKSEEIDNLKQQRLSYLTEQYAQCLSQTLKPLLERTHCMAEARRKIEHVGIEHSLPSDSNLPAMYTEEIEHALAEKNYEHAEKVLLDWQNLLPKPSEQRDALRKKLTLYQQVENIIADITGTNKEQIVKRLNQLTVDEAFQKEVLGRPDVQNSLLRYHLNEALALITAEEGQVEINSSTVLKLEQILTVARKEETTLPPSQLVVPPTPWYADSTSQRKSPTSQVANLLQECKRHYEANRLTTGRQGTALVCYRTVLKRSPGNREAKKGLKAIENRYKHWAEKALRLNRLDKVQIYLAGLKKVSPNSRSLARLKRRLKAAKTSAKATKPRSKPRPKATKPRPTTKKSTRPKPKSPPARVVIKPSKPKPVSPPPPVPVSCEGCNCSDLLKQLSMGVKPLTRAQQNYFQTRCR
jgi:flagellar basal body-associated protein FliL